MTETIGDRPGCNPPTEDEKSCLNCRHLTEEWINDEDGLPRDCDPECIKHPWDTLPDEAIESDAWELECPKYCGSFEAIASAVGQP